MKAGQVASDYTFNKETFDILFGEASPLDSFSFVGNLQNEEQVSNFLAGYGVDTNDPIEMVELFGHFQEALGFIRKFFLKPQSSTGLDFDIPKEITTLVDIKNLYLLGREEVGEDESLEVKIWASIILKIMHVILHINKDLRQNYFTHIQTQIFDRYYKYLERKDGRLFLEGPFGSVEIQEFQTKSKKSRDSVVMKLLHKKQAVAEELFDRIGVRVITKTKFDCLRVFKFLCENHVVMPQNLKPSRTHNSLVDLKKFFEKYDDPNSSASNSIAEFNEKLSKITDESPALDQTRTKNEHTLQNYRSIHLTCRQLIKYVNPLASQLEKLRLEAFSDNSRLGNLVQKMDSSSLMRELKFFYPYEIQVTDLESHVMNSEGESSHKIYKASQRKAAMNRIFKYLIEFKKAR